MADAKTHVENAIAGMNFTTIQASFFMEIWLSPYIGFDYPNAAAASTAPAQALIGDALATVCRNVKVLASGIWQPNAVNPDSGGPEQLARSKVVAIFERLAANNIQLNAFRKMLRTRLRQRRTRWGKSFAALMLGYLYGDAMNMAPIQEEFGIDLMNVETYARRVLAAQ